MPVGSRGAQAAVALTAIVAAAYLATVALGSSRGTSRDSAARSVDVAAALVAGRDGKLAVAGVSTRKGTKYGREFAVARYASSGNLERSFGTSGKVLTSFGVSNDAGATSIALRPDGGIADLAPEERVGRAAWR